MSEAPQSASRTARRIVCLTVAIVAAMIPASASAQSDITGQSMFGTAEPYQQDAIVYGPASLRIVWDTAYDPGSHPSNQTLSEAVIELDNDFAIDLTGLTQCPGANLSGTTTEAAIAVCSTALLGRNGGATLTGAGGSFAGVVTAFRGEPVSGEPVILLHVRFGAPISITAILSGRVRPSMLGGDFGTEILFAVPDTAATGTVFTHMDFRINNLEAIPTSRYFTARCFDPDHYWNYQGFFDYRNHTGLQVASQVQQCTNPPTMTASLPITHKKKRKCKKKRKRGKGAVAAKKCKKRKR